MVQKKNIYGSARIHGKDTHAMREEDKRRRFGLAPSAPILTAQEMTALIVRIGDIHDDLNMLKLGATLHNLKGTWWNP